MAVIFRAEAGNVFFFCKSQNILKTHHKALSILPAEVCRLLFNFLAREVGWRVDCCA